MWHMKGKIIGWYEDGKWTFGQVNGRWFRKIGRRGYVDVEIMGGKGWWTKFEIGFDKTIGVEAGKVWVHINGKWRRCGR